MHATKKREFHTAFVVNDAALEKLDQILGEFGPRTYTVSLADGLTLKCGDLQGLRQQTNDGEKPIIEIVASTPWSESQRATIRLRRPEKSEIAAVDYDLVGEDRDVYVLSGKLDQWIAAHRPAYAPIALSEMVPFASFIAGLVFFIMIVAALPTSESAVQAAKVAGKPPPSVDVAPIWAWVLTPVALVATWLRNRLMPVADFSIGYGAERSQRIGWWRNAVILALALGVASSIVATKLTQ